MGNSKNCNFICFCCTTTCNNRARCLYTTLRGRELLFLNSILKKMCFWCFLLKATFVSEPAALDAGSPEASPKGSPFPTANHVITVSRMAPVNNKALLPKKNLSLMLEKTGTELSTYQRSETLPSIYMAVSAAGTWLLEELLGEHPRSRVELLKHSGLGI